LELLCTGDCSGLLFRGICGLSVYLGEVSDRIKVDIVSFDSLPTVLLIVKLLELVLEPIEVLDLIFEDNCCINLAVWA
jgi:hypothetical protein